MLYEYKSGNPAKTLHALARLGFDGLADLWPIK
jgi:hypothetical protein